MPIYNYHCQKCDVEMEASASISARDAVKIHTCGGRMKRVLSLPLPAIIARTGRGMALDSLNSGKAIPDRWYKSEFEKGAAAGAESYQRRVW